MSKRLDQLLDFLKESPNDPFLIYALATEYLKANDSEKALALYERLVSEHPDYVGTYYHLGKLYQALDKNDEAVNIYEKGMQAARTKRDMHALSELQAAYYAIVGEEGDDEDY